MRRGLLLAGLLAWAATAQANPTWDSLWHTDEQRGQQLLRQGKPAEAARLFREPRRKAYAELQAGNFQQAAQDFAALGDSDSQYNRGNALARAGRLQEAIQAYDTALARDPANRDARHNRDLVAKALQQQPPPKPHPASDQNRKDAGRSGEAGQKKDGGSGTQNGNAQKDMAGQNVASGAQAKPAGSNGPPQAQPRPGRPQPGQPPSAAAQPSASGPQQQANDSAEARSDAAAALGRPQPGARPAPADVPRSERQLAEQQWLRRIPDDPGGLLRRKFLIEHLIRQQGTQP